MSIVEVLSIYKEQYGVLLNNNLLSEAERNEGIKEKYYMKLIKL
jgi:hypothetical protein